MGKGPARRETRVAVLMYPPQVCREISMPIALHLRGDRYEINPGHGFCTAASASAAMHAGKGLAKEGRAGVLSRNLEKSLHRALAHANERRHEYATLEHLLLALTEDQDAVAVLRACSVDLDRLRREVLNYVDNELANLVAAHGDDAKPTASFQRVLQRAAIHVQSSGREEVTGASVLVAMFAERESHAVFFLQGQDITRSDIVNYLSHGIPKAPGGSGVRQVRGSHSGGGPRGGNPGPRLGYSRPNGSSLQTAGRDRMGNVGAGPVC